MGAIERFQGVKRHLPVTHLLCSLDFVTIVSIMFICPAWNLLYKAVAGVSNPDPYELWMSNEVLNDGVSDAYKVTDDFKGHLQTTAATLWDKLQVAEVSQCHSFEGKNLDKFMESCQNSPNQAEIKWSI